MEKVYGTVKEIKGENAVVFIKRDSMCGDSCASCNLCAMKDTCITVENPINAKVGDKVWIEMESGGLLAAFLVYGGPVLIILLAVVASAALQLDELITLAFMGAGILLWYVFVKIAEKFGITKGKCDARIVDTDSVEGDLN